MQKFQKHPLAELEFYCENRTVNETAGMNRRFDYFMNVSARLCWDAWERLGCQEDDGRLRIGDFREFPSLIIKSPFHYERLRLPNAALLSVLLLMSTFLLAIFINRVRMSTLFGRSVSDPLPFPAPVWSSSDRPLQIRRALGDFSLAIAVICVVLFDLLVLPTDEGTGKVAISNHFLPAYGDDTARPWSRSLPVGPTDGFNCRPCPGWCRRCRCPGPTSCSACSPGSSSFSSSSWRTKLWSKETLQYGSIRGRVFERGLGPGWT